MKGLTIACCLLAGAAPTASPPEPRVLRYEES
jgi:hypothetical protein